MDNHSSENLLIKDINSQETLLRKDIHSLELKIEQFKTDIYKAIFWSNIGQLITILTGVLAIFRFMKWLIFLIRLSDPGDSMYVQ